MNGIGLTGGGRFTFKPTTPAARANSFFTDVFVGSNVYKITVKGTVDTTPSSGDTGVGPVFGISGSAVALQATLFISATANPTPVFREEGSNVGGYGHLSDFRGYNEILSIHFSMQGSNPAATPTLIPSSNFFCDFLKHPSKNRDWRVERSPSRSVALTY